jgi:hypothetical protein
VPGKISSSRISYRLEVSASHGKLRMGIGLDPAEFRDRHVREERHIVYVTGGKP